MASLLARDTQVVIEAAAICVAVDVPRCCLCYCSTGCVDSPLTSPADNQITPDQSSMSFYIHNTDISSFYAIESTMCKTRPAGRVRPASRFCPAREMFLSYNGEPARGKPSTTPTLHHKLWHRKSRLFTTSSPKRQMS